MKYSNGLPYLAQLISFAIPFENIILSEISSCFDNPPIRNVTSFLWLGFRLSPVILREKFTGLNIP